MGHRAHFHVLMAVFLFAVLSSAVDIRLPEPTDCYLEYDAESKKVWGCLEVYEGNALLPHVEIQALGALAAAEDSKEARWSSADDRGLRFRWSDELGEMTEAKVRLFTNEEAGYSALAIVPEGDSDNYAVTKYCLEFVVQGMRNSEFKKGSVKGIENHPGCPWNGSGFVDRYLRLAEYIAQRVGFLVMSLQDSASFTCRARCDKTIRTWASLFEIFKNMNVEDDKVSVPTFYEKHGGFKFGVSMRTPVSFEESKIMIHKLKVEEFLNVATERLAGEAKLKLQEDISKARAFLGDDAFGDGARLGENMVALWTGKGVGINTDSDKCEACNVYNAILIGMIEAGSSSRPKPDSDPATWIEAVSSYMSIWQSGELTKWVKLHPDGGCDC